MGEANNGTVVMGKDEACSFAMTMATASVPSLVLKTVIELDILEIIKRAGPAAQLSANQIATHLPRKNPNAGVMLDRMLRMLASHQVLSCSVRSLPDGRVERLYGLTPVCDFLTKDEDEPTLETMSLLVNDKITLEIWNHLKDTVLDGGIAMVRAYGKAVHDYQGVNEKYNQLFNSTMAAYSHVVLKKILETYKGFEGLSTLLDVGGGTGTTLNKIISKYPTIKGINFELPHVIKDAPSFKGVEHVGGDFFVKVPNADAIFMKWILGDWGDEDCVKILKVCYEALPDHGKVIACEYNIPVDPETSYHAKTMFNVDVLRLVHEIGGKERTEQEFRTLGKLAGFKGFKVACSAYDFAVMEFYKN